MIPRQRVAVRPLDARFGAEVLGIGSLPALSAGDLADLKDALLEHKVLGLRGQGLGPAEHRRFLARFGTLTPPGAGQPGQVHPLGRWVTEKSYLLTPPTIVSLRATSPEVDGECTLLADVDAAYRALPRPLRALADHSWAVHAPYGTHAPPGDLVAHPVTRLHPETGDRGLVLGGHARQILGLTPGESRTLVHVLQSYLVHPGNVVRWDWREGDVILFDARAVQHHARPGTAPRPASTASLEVAGDRILGVDGQHSHHVSPELSSGPTERRSA